MIHFVTKPPQNMLYEALHQEILQQIMLSGDSIYIARQQFVNNTENVPCQHDNVLKCMMQNKLRTTNPIQELSLCSRKSYVTDSIGGDTSKMASLKVAEI